MYAEVVVNLPIRAGRTVLDKTFHYSIPPHLEGRVAVGQMVQIPFGAGRRAGVVVAFSESSPVPETKDIEAIVDIRLTILPHQIELARWLSRYYLSPLYKAISLMFPPGVQRQPEAVVEAGQAAEDGLMPAQAEFLDFLRRQGPVEIYRLPRRWQALVPEMAKRGLVQKTSLLPGPRVRPRHSRFVYLTADEEKISAETPHLGHHSKRAAALALLAAQGKSPIPLKEVCAAIGCKESPIRTLAERGWVEISGRRGMRTVELTLPLEEVPARIAELRGAKKHLAVLELLQREGGAVWLGWIYAETECTLETLRDLAAHGLIRLEEEEVWRDPLAGKKFPPESPPKLTEEQEKAWQEIRKGLERKDGSVYLLHGVTGSGKTEIYLRALELVLARGEGGIVLVPEISLTPQTIGRFAARFPKSIAVWHSQLSLGERYDSWRRIRAGELKVVIGPRSALFAPVPNLGAIIVDEEHESSYKQDELEPRYHARDVALQLGRLTGATVVLGSATPDVATYYWARRGEFRLLELPRRILRPAEPDEKEVRFSALPPVQVVDLRQELKAGNRSIFSRALQGAMQKALAAGEQVILFLNRRGTATFVMCRDCGWVVKCHRCDVPLTYHVEEGGKELVCHHCNRRQEVPKICARCRSMRIRFFGIGTQKVEEAACQLFPQARVMRWDRDVVRYKGAHEEIWERFSEHEADILIGTQIIAKGLDLPLVTVVGVVSADTALNLPDFRAAERTFQLLTQVAGRAGRSTKGGQVIVQTYTPEHYAIQAASRHDYAAFYRKELAFRREHGYPPFGRLARLIYVHPHQERCRAEAERVGKILEEKIASLSHPGIALIGPAPCFLSRIRGRYRWQIVLRASEPQNLLADLPLPPGWQVDVDPVNVL